MWCWRAERPARQLYGERTVRNVLFYLHSQPTACQARPSQSQGHTALGSLSSTLQQSPYSGPGKPGGKYLLSRPLALGLTRSTPEPPTTSIPEGLHHTHTPYPLESFLGAPPSLCKARLCSNKGRLNCYEVGAESHLL